MAEVVVVVADGSCAKLFSYAEGSLELIELLEHQQGRLHERDLETDTRGRSEGRGSKMGRRDLAPDRRPKDHERVVFVNEVGRHLNRLHGVNELSDVFLVAPPALLGELKSVVPRGVRIAGTLSKEMIRQSPHQILEQLGLFERQPAGRTDGLKFPPSRSPAIRGKEGRAPQIGGEPHYGEPERGW